MSGDILIPLTIGYSALISESAADLVTPHEWKAFRSKRTNAYAFRDVKRAKGVYDRIYMHRVVLGLPLGRTPEVDHINGTLIPQTMIIDNRNENLRLATPSQNRQNQVKRLGTSSIYKGVGWHFGRWRAYIKENGKTRDIGRFTDEAEAARAYDEVALELFGEFARLNFPSK